MRSSFVSRKSSLSLAMLIPLLLVLFTSTASAASAVLGIDLGTNFIKAAIVKPGTPLDIVLTKDSKRKEASVVAFKPDTKKPVELGHFPERLYGGDALALGGRFPGDVYTHLKPLLGLTPDDAAIVDAYKAAHPAIKVQSIEKSGSTLIRSGSAFSDKEVPWSVEELLAMELKNIRTNAEAMAGKGSRITEAVITIPSFYTAEERRAVQRAADLAGIDVMALISDGLAVGVDYAVKREFPNVSKGGKPEYHLIFDMGAGSTTATILRFQGKDVKDIGRYNKTVQEVTVVGAGWDRALGGNSMNGLLVDHIVNEFTKMSSVQSAGISVSEVKEHGRTSSKLWREAERARQVLSANSDVRSSFEGLYQDIDFKTVVSRAQFEKLASEFADRVEMPVRQALEAAKLTVADLDSIIMHGGTTRTPFVRERLEAIAGKSTEVRSNVNADESAAFGAAFKAAGLSPSFKVKEIRDADAAIYAAGVTHQTDSKQRQQKLFVPTSAMGTAKQLTFKDKEDFVFGLYQQVDGSDRQIVEVQTRNLSASVAALVANFGCTKDDISTKFNLRLNPINGVPEVLSGAVSCEVDGAIKAGGIGDSVKGLFGFGGKKGDQEPLKEDDAATSTDQVTAGSSSTKSANASASSAAAKDAKPKKRTETINIDFGTTPKNLIQPSTEDIARMRERLAAFDRSDKGRIQREEALNVLEAFTYRARDLLTDAGFEQASTEDARAKLTSLLSSTSEWLYGEGATAPTDVLKTKLSDLRALVDPVQLRQKEALSRPAAIESVEKVLNTTKQMVAAVADQIKKTEEAAKEAEEAAASPTSSSTDGDELDDADPIPSKPAFEHPKMFAPYTWEDWDELKEKYDAAAKWYEENGPSLKSLTSTETPQFLAKEIEAKANDLNDFVNRLMNRKFEQAKQQQKAETKRSKSTKAKTTTSTSTKSRDIPDFTPEPEGKLSPEDEEYILNMVRDEEAKYLAKGGDLKDEEVEAEKPHDEL